MNLSIDILTNTDRIALKKVHNRDGYSLVSVTTYTFLQKNNQESVVVVFGSRSLELRVHKFEIF